jgi:hypothetical protein
VADLETRSVHYDYEVELPSGLWHVGKRKLQMRMHLLARGYEDEAGKFIVRNVVKIEEHIVEPEDWEAPKNPEDDRRRSKVQ